MKIRPGVYCRGVSFLAKLHADNRMDAFMRMTTVSASLITAVLLGTPFAAQAQSKAAIEKKLQAEYTTTQATADQTDIVTAGSILVLKKGNIIMGSGVREQLLSEHL